MSGKDWSEIVTVNEAAAILRVSRESVRRRIQDGTLRAVRIGPRALRVAASDVRALLAPVAPTKVRDGE